MAYKLADLLKKINEKSGVQSQEIETLAQAGDIADKEISDEEGEKLFSEIDGLLTKDAALNNPEVEKHYKENYGAKQKKSLLNEVDKSLFEKLDSYLDEETINSIKEKEKTTDKIQVAIDSLAENKKEDANSQTKEALEEYKNKLKKVQEEKDQELQKLKEERDNVVSDYNNRLLYHKFQTKVKDYKFAEAYDKPHVKDMVINNVWESIKKSAEPQLTEDGEIKLFRKDNPEMELYGDDNKPATLDKLAEKHLSEFIKKSDGGGNDQSSGQSQQKRPNGNPDSQNTPPNGNTVQGMIQAQREQILPNGQ